MRYEHIRKWTEDGFRLDLWDTGRTDRLGKTVLRYCLFDGGWKGGRIIFDGEDFACSPLHAIDCDECVAAVLGFLSLRKGDTDAEYFDGYTAEQLAWRDDRAELLALHAHELEHGGGR